MLKDSFQIYKITDKPFVFFMLICLCLSECRWQHEQSSERELEGILRRAETNSSWKFWCCVPAVC